MKLNITKSNFFSYRQHYCYDRPFLQRQSASSYTAHHPKDHYAHYAFKAGHHLSLPWRSCLRFVAYALEPHPGANKNRRLEGMAIRVTSFLVASALLPLGLLSIPLALPFHLFSHSRRPLLSVIHNEKAPSSLHSDNTLKVRTHNLGFVYESMRIVGDLRKVTTRAAEIGRWIEQDAERPEVIVFQEAFHQDGTRMLCKALQKQYPYVVHNIAPHMLGLCNGAVIASQYPIEELTYRPFTNMLGPEKWSTRGLIKIRLLKIGKKVDIYETHLQALLGKERSAVRARQMKQIDRWIQKDQGNNPADTTILLGDLNASKLTAWGEANHEDDELFQIMEDHYIDVFSNDHDAMGARTSGVSKHSLQDTPEGISPLEEPSGTWYLGLFASKGAMMKGKEWYERVFKNAPLKTKVKNTKSLNVWGTKKWALQQPACTARFDYILRYKKHESDGVSDRAEIRRVKVSKSTQSAPSDHAPVDALIHL